MIDYYAAFVTAWFVIPILVSGIILGIVLHIGTIHTDRTAND